MDPFIDETTRPVKVPVCVQAVRTCRPAVTRILGPQVGETTPVPGGAGLLVGRGSEAHVRLDDETVSRIHCRIHCERDGSVVLTDMGSTNGTIVNGAPVREARLSEGDKIQVGVATVFRFSLNDRLDENYLEHLYQLSIRDALTGLHNRRYLLECLERDVALARRHGLPLALVLLDADDFKAINDTHGHDGGDEVLRRLADRLARMQRRESILARYGGEEFAVLLRNVGPEGADVFAERMRAAVEEARFPVAGADVRVTVSVGVAVSTADGVDEPEALLKRADRYLYASKARGRNRVTSRRTPAP